MSRRLLPAPLLAIAGTLAACAPAGESEVRLHRLVDAPPAAYVALADDTRPVLATPLPGPRTLERGPLDIPAAASLRFAIGRAGAGTAPVAFRVQACAGDDCRDVFAETLGAEVATWQERSVAAPELAGPRTRLRFEVDAPPDAGGLWAHPELVAPGPRAGPSLVLVSLDTLGARHLPAYGYPRATAPFFSEELAGRGTLFERCISSASTTGPSHMTMFTSLQPSVHGVVGSAAYSAALPAGVPTLAEHLAAAGFATGAVTDDGPLAHHRGFGRGFDRYHENTSVRLEGAQLDATLARAFDWLERHRDRASFLFVHSYQVHAPYVPPKEYSALFRDGGVEPPPRPGVPPESHPVRYDREIRYADDQLRAFFERLRAAGLDRDTVFVVTSDHGEAFLQHGFLAHGADVHEEVVHVPLLFVGPGVAAGRRVEAPVGLVDLLPTLLELAGQPAPDDRMGRSFADLVRRGRDDGSRASRPLYSEAWRRRALVAGGRWREVAVPSLAVQRGGRKLVRIPNGDGSFRHAYYDLEADPREQRDLYAEAPADAAELRALLDRYQEVTAELRATVRAGAPEAAPALGPERTEKLRALGYLE